MLSLNRVGGLTLSAVQASPCWALLFVYQRGGEAGSGSVWGRAHFGPIVVFFIVCHCLVTVCALVVHKFCTVLCLCLCVCVLRLCSQLFLNSSDDAHNSLGVTVIVPTTVCLSPEHDAQSSLPVVIQVLAA